MKYPYPTLLAALLALALPACLSLESEEQKAAALEKTVLARHDELMAHLDEVYELRQQLRQLPAGDTARTGRYRRALTAGDAAMLDWMHKYKRPADSLPPAQRLTYFQQQHVRIDSVGHLMETSIDSARLLLQPTAKPLQR